MRANNDTTLLDSSATTFAFVTCAVLAFVAFVAFGARAAFAFVAFVAFAARASSAFTARASSAFAARASSAFAARASSAFGPRASFVFSLALVGVMTSTSACFLLPPSSAVSLCEAQVRAQCELAFRCCEPDERVGIVGAYITSEGECFERSAPACKVIGSITDDSIALQRTRFDSEKASECVAQLNQARDECDRGIAQRAQAVCGAVFVGIVEDGDECALANECADGGLCDFGDGDEVDEENNALVGECLALPGEGEECANGVCAAGLFCNPGANECDMLPGEGDTCTGACASGLFCNDDEECEQQKVDGEDCVNGQECLSGFCADDTCGGVDPGLCNGL